MRAPGLRGDDSWTSFGGHRGFADSARFGLDLTRARADSEGAAGPGSYPSPPMSGSPPLPPKPSQQVAEQSQGTYQTTAQGAYPGIPATQSEERAQTGVAGGPRPFPPDVSERTLYPFPRLEGPAARPLSYPPQLGQAVAQPPAYLPGPGTRPAPGHLGPLPAPQPYAAVTHHPIPIQDPLHHTPPKPQRKTKGHVASACVPCKRAHLRCDAQRPCSRCVSTNKEGACVDVQHKKRGRPRLRDDGQARYEGTRFGGAGETMRRPLSSAYGPGPTLGMVYDDPLRRTQSYRVLKSQPAESTGPRFPERGLAPDANIYPAPLSISTARAVEEPVAYLTIGLEFAKASTPFLRAIGRHSVNGLELGAVLVAEERSRASRLQQQAQEEQTRKEPTYLPPIFADRGESVMQSLGFSPEEVSRYPLQWLDTFTFVGDDGQSRAIPLRAGLATRNSIYFVVLLLSRMPRSSSYPTPSPSLRDLTGSVSYEPGLPGYSQPTPLSATFDPRQSRLSDPGGHDPRPPGQHGAPLHMLAAPSPALSSGYGVSPSRLDYPMTPRTFQAPRAEVHPPSRPPPPAQASDYHQLLPLPRIRSPPPGAVGPAGTQQLESPQPQLQPPSRPPPPPPPSYDVREERSRIGIGGLIEPPETTRSP